MAFKEDLERGKQMEEKVITALSLMEGDNTYIANPNEKGIDILVVSGGIEVKADHYAFDKGLALSKTNAYIEWECNGKPSGINKEDEHTPLKWAHSLQPNEVYILDTPSLREWVRNKIGECEANVSLTSKGCRMVTGGDGNRSKGLLIPASQFAELAEDILYI